MASRGLPRQREGHLEQRRHPFSARPDIIEDIHRRFLEKTGADIIETNTFSAHQHPARNGILPRRQEEPRVLQSIIEDQFLVTSRGRSIPNRPEPVPQMGGYRRREKTRRKR
ncbi:MAG: homocysteine S-methyltransferase family protein [Prosthecobacter sp.]